MGFQDRSKNDGVRDEILAGEYVLGVLGDEARASVEERMRSDRSFASIVKRWHENLQEGREQEIRIGRAMMRLPVQPREPVTGRGAMLALWYSTAFWRVAALWLAVLSAVLAFS